MNPNRKLPFAVRRWPFAVALALAVPACGGKPNEPAKPPMSQRARESALAKSGLPGATGIGTALRVSDSADARRKREDSLANAVP